MDRSYTLRELETLLYLSPSTLRNRIREGRLAAVKRYRGGNKADPRSWRWLVRNEAGIRFMQREILSTMTATTPRFPGFIRRERFCSTK